MKPTRAVFDASVVVRAALGRAPSAKAWLESLRDGRAAAIAPDLIYAEVASAYVQHMRTRSLQVDDAMESLAEIVDLPFDVRPNRALCEIAVAVAARTGLTAYDAHYLALAEAEDAVLVTADRALAEAASQSVLLE